jgi:tetratricopeptide (TPR) repeat protein
MKLVCLGAIFSCALLCPAANAQDLVVRALTAAPASTLITVESGQSDARINPITRTPDLLILLSPDALGSEDLGSVQTFMIALFQGLHSKIPIRLGVIDGGSVSIAGPFHTAPEMRAAFRGVHFEALTVPPADTPSLMTALAASLDSIPSDWGYTLIAGHVGQFQNAGPGIENYAVAWLTRKFAAQKRSVLFWEPPGVPSPAWTQIVSRNTGGFGFDQPAELAQTLLSPEYLIELIPNLKPPAHGFRLDSIDAESIPELAGVHTPVIASSTAIPAIAQFAELAMLTRHIETVLADTNASTAELASAREDLEKALGINSADWTAVKLGISLTERQKDIPGELPLLEEAVELKPDDAGLWQTLGDLEYDRRDFVHADTSLARARDLGVRSARIAERLGRIRYSSGDYATASAFIDESLRLDPNQQQLWFMAAMMAKSAGDSAKQMLCLEKALAGGGRYTEQRAELIRLYFAKGDAVNAGRHADLELPDLPPEPDIQTTWARFYEELSRPKDALALWTKVVQTDPKREAAHSAITTILLKEKRFPDALEAAERGLENAPASPRLQLAKAVALENLDRIYEARHSLDSFAGKTEDIDLLAHQAEVTDKFGGNASASYRRLVSALAASGSQSDRLQASLERGWKVSLREQDADAATWFASKLSSDPAGGQAAKPQGPAKKPNGIWIPGGADALMFAARGPGRSPPARFMVDYCRTVLANEPGPAVAETKIYRNSMDEYFGQLKTLLAMGVRSGNLTVINVSIADKKLQKQTEGVLEILGWRLRRNKQQILVESNEKSSQARKQDLPSALAIDQAGMQSAFEAGKTFRIEIPWEFVPLAVDEPILRALGQSDKLNGGIPQAFADSPDLARFYIGMSRLDYATVAALTTSVNTNVLATKFSSSLEFYSSALAVAGNRVLAPGGPSADPAWTTLAGVSPADPIRFLRVLLEKDEGALLAFFSDLSQLDSAHQRFFTLSAKRASSFYRLFSQSSEARLGPGRPNRNGSFAGFLREIPLNEDSSVDFPGGPEVWMVAKGGSKTANQSQKLLQKVRKAVAPDLEDEILLRIASTVYSVGAAKATELDNFLAVAHIDAHRSDPLDEESALLLAQNLSAYKPFYPYFALLPDLTAADFKSMFSLGAKLTALDAIDADLAMGQFFSVMELIRLSAESGRLQEPQAAALFRSVCGRFLAAQSQADFTVAALDSVREMVGSTPPDDADSTLAAMVLGGSAPFEMEWNGATRSLDPAGRRVVQFKKVLNLQKAPSVSLLLKMDAATRSVAVQKGPVEPLIAELLKGAASLPAVEIPRADKIEGKPKQAIERYSLVRLPAMIAELREKALKKKANPKDLEKPAREILTEFGPQIRLAVAGIVYAAYLSPADSLVANDPLLLRKHESFELHATSSAKPAFVPSDLIVANSNGGSYFVGGFGDFSFASGTAAILGVRSNTPDTHLFARQLSAIRMTAWSQYRDDDQQLLGMRIRIAREWIVYSASQPALLRDLSEDTLGILSLTRRRELLNAIGSQDWPAVWNSVTLSDLLSLAGRYAARYKESPWNSPLDTALRGAGVRNDGSRLNLLGALPLTLYGCGHPHLVTFAPYEEYEKRLFPTELSERTAEMKIYLSDLMDKLGLPAAAMQTIAEPAARMVFRSMRMSDNHDWAGALAAFSAMDEKTIGAALDEAAK